MTIRTFAVSLLAFFAALFAPRAGHASPDDNKAADRSTAFEVNVLWPLFPGGISDLKLVIPTTRSGHAIVGLHSDFAWRSVRDDDAGRVAILALKLGYRQFFGHGLHVDVSVNAGWRHEKDNPIDGRRIDALQARLWIFAGYQRDLNRTWYINARYGLGIHLLRTDRHADQEKQLIPATGDLNVGIRF